MSTNERPDLSVVMTIVDGDSALVRALEALRRQTDPPTLEIIVPFDDTIADTANLASRFPEVRFVPLGSLSPPGVALGPFAQHLLVHANPISAIVQVIHKCRPAPAHMQRQLHPTARLHRRRRRVGGLCVKMA